MKNGKKGGCGCGGKGGCGACGGKGGCGACGANGGCGCGAKRGARADGTPIAGTVCDPCQEAAFVRPRFFAGQLLTEDDFEALVAYIVGKDRLRNARLFGAGVVCGFEVTCDPCGHGKVVVKPGYALDCCGNDLVLSCDRRLDLNQMIAALRAAQHGGHGCEDPCRQTKEQPACDPEPQPDDKTSDQAPVPASPPRMQAPPTPPSRFEPPNRLLPPGWPDFDRQPGYRPPAERPTTDQPRPDCEPVPPPPAEYCLYVRYDERPTEPVARYATDDDCGELSCEPTRIAEGVTFELRCPAPRTATSDVFDALVHALECLDDNPSLFQDLVNLQYLAQRSRTVGDVIDAPTPVKPKALTPRQIETWTIGASHWLGQPPSTPRTMELARRLAEFEGPYRATLHAQATPDEGGREHRAAARPLAKAAASADALIDKASSSTESLLDQVRGEVAAAATFDGERPLPLSTVERAFLRTVAERSSRAPAVAEKPEAMQRGDWRYAHGLASGELLDAAVARAGKDLATAVAMASSCTPDVTPDCKLVDDAAALARAFATFDLSPAFQQERPRVFVIGQILELFVRYLVSRMCTVINPPCRPCDDPAVLLACVEIDGCKVVRICNLSRDYVWSPTALQHWLPPARWLGQVFEEICCASGKGWARDRADDDAGDAALEDLDAQITISPTLLAGATAFYRHHMHPRLMTHVFGSLGQFFRQELRRAGLVRAMPATNGPSRELGRTL